MATESHGVTLKLEIKLWVPYFLRVGACVLLKNEATKVPPSKFVPAGSYALSSFS